MKFLKKQLTLLFIILIFTINMVTFAATNEVEVTIPEFGVMIGGEEIDNEHNEYPLIVYKDITYFPMTWNFSRSLGLSSDWDSEMGLAIAQSSDTEKLVQDRSVTNDLSKTYTAQIPDFGIQLNGNTISNGEEEYPILLFRDITYFPLTWKFTVDEFGWESGWDDSKGLSIVNNNIQTTIDIDESNNNTTTISDVSDSSVVVNNNNIDNSVNDSNNVYNNYSTTINNFIDNSVSINNMSANSLAELLAILMGVETSSLNTSIIVYDTQGNKIKDAVLYINNEAKGVSDVNGVIQFELNQSGEYLVKVRKSEYQQHSKSTYLTVGIDHVVTLEQVKLVTNYKYTGEYKRIYPAYAEANRNEFHTNIIGHMLDYEQPKVTEIRIVDTETGANVASSWKEVGSGGHYGYPYLGVQFTIDWDYNNARGLKPDVTYQLIVKTDYDEVTSTIQAVTKPIIKTDGSLEISIAGDYAYAMFEIVSNHRNINQTLFALVDQNGNVIFQETDKFVMSYRNYIQFELVNSELLNRVNHLYLRPIEKDEVYFTDVESAEYSITYEPIMLGVDYDIFDRTSTGYTEQVHFKFYGYNIAGNNYKAYLEKDNVKIKELNATAVKGEDGRLDYVEYFVDYDSLEKVGYHIDIIDFGGFGTFHIE